MTIRKDPKIVRYLENRGINVPQSRINTATTSDKSKVQLNADTVHAKSCAQSRFERFALTEGKFYMLEIVRPLTEESKALWGLDGIKRINGQTRVVSKVRMYVFDILKKGDIVELGCRGQDNQGRNADGTYIYYISPDARSSRGTFVLSIREC